MSAHLADMEALMSFGRRRALLVRCWLQVTIKIDQVADVAIQVPAKRLNDVRLDVAKRLGTHPAAHGHFGQPGALGDFLLRNAPPLFGFQISDQLLQSATQCPLPSCVLFRRYHSFSSCVNNTLSNTSLYIKAAVDKLRASRYIYLTAAIRHTPLSQS